jgi:hypothetical protein
MTQAPSITDFHFYTKIDDFPESLRHYVDVSDTITVFKHPFSTDFLPMALPVPVEEFLAFRENQARQLMTKGSWLNFVFFHSRPFRMDILADLVRGGHFRKNPEAYWDLARAVWADSEQPEDDARWRLLLNPGLPGRSAMTHPRDRPLLEAMSETIILYRGVHADDDATAKDAALSGWSWSLKEDTAAWFAQRLIGQSKLPYVIAATVAKRDVIAYLTSRNEDEIIVDPTCVQVNTVTLQTAKKSRKGDLVPMRGFA